MAGGGKSADGGPIKDVRWFAGNDLDGIGLVSSSLLDRAVRATVLDVLANREGRTRNTPDLSPIAAFAIYSTTLDALSEDEFMDLLGSPGTQTDPHTFSRWRRRAPAVRSQKIDTLRTAAFEIVKSGKVVASKIVRGWALTLIHEAAVSVMNLKEAAPLLEAVDRSGVNEDQAMDLLSELVHDMLNKVIGQEMAVAQGRVEKGYADAAFEYVFQLSTSNVLATMADSDDLIDTSNYLETDMFPRLDRALVPQPAK